MRDINSKWLSNQIEFGPFESQILKILDFIETIVDIGFLIQSRGWCILHNKVWFLFIIRETTETHNGRFCRQSQPFTWSIFLFIKEEQWRDTCVRIFFFSRKQSSVFKHFWMSVLFWGNFDIDLMIIMIQFNYFNTHSFKEWHDLIWRYLFKKIAGIKNKFLGLFIRSAGILIISSYMFSTFHTTIRPLPFTHMSISNIKKWLVLICRIPTFRNRFTGKSFAYWLPGR